MKDIRCGLEIDATVVANAFIDHYMASASGEYVKVYLYLLRHAGEAFGVSEIAEALGHTEADVNRAVSYWERAGILGRKANNPVEEVKTPESPEEPKDSEQDAERKPCTVEQMNRLNEDEDFSQLLYIAQKYMNKIFRPQECEIFAYLYDVLGIKAEVLEYLLEYCAQNNHTNIRYVERVALNWHERGLHTLEEAKAYTAGFRKNSFAVMKAFGLTGRGAGEKELEMIDTWFGSYGFSKDLVIEACNRTLESTHQPSFKYADSILQAWRRQGVKSMGDVNALDSRHSQERAASASGKAGAPKNTTAGNTKNQFHNFKQRDTDYNAMVMQRLKERLQEQ